MKAQNQVNKFNIQNAKKTKKVQGTNFKAIPA